MNFFAQIGQNRIIMVTIITWFVAQFMKVFIGLLREKKFNFKWLVGTGGMPSSHCAGAMAFATSLGMERGFDSPVFAIGMIFALVTMFDAQSSRRAIGKQAGLLNKMFEDIYLKKPIKEERLIEIIGHTPVEVLTGAGLGILLGTMLYMYL